MTGSERRDLPLTENKCAFIGMPLLSRVPYLRQWLKTQGGTSRISPQTISERIRLHVATVPGSWLRFRSLEFEVVVVSIRNCGLSRHGTEARLRAGTTAGTPGLLVGIRRSNSDEGW